MVEKQDVGLVNVVPALQEVAVIPVSDLNPKIGVLEIRPVYGGEEEGAGLEPTFSTSL